MSMPEKNLDAPELSNGQAGSEKRAIRVDYRDAKGDLNPMFKECVGAGRANEGLRADWQAQLTLAKKECDFKYIRMHGLLTDDMGVYAEDKSGNPQLNFQYVDVLFDFLLGIGVKPFVEIGFMPSALASGPETIFWWRGNVTPPKDYLKWGFLIEGLLRHFVERYGREEVKTWYFEVWNEPNLSGFWAGTQDEYFKLYSHTAKALKRVGAEFRVGGPATAGAAWVPEMIGFCRKNGLPLDFVSTHAYGVKQGYLDEFGVTGTVLDQDPESVSRDVERSRSEIEASEMPGLELHYTEWSSSYTPADPIHDSYHQAAYVLEKIKQVGARANSMSYWVFTDIFEEAGPRFTPFHGGFGLLNYQSIKKPAFFSYKFMNELGSAELRNPDHRSYACKNERGDVQVLAWDFTITHPGDSVNNQAYYIQDLPARARGTISIEIEGMPAGTYAMEVFKVGYRVNDPYSSYLSMGKPTQLSRAQVEKIMAENDGSPVEKCVVSIGADSTFRKALEIRENDVFLLKLSRT
jgi:xylan 1,4-beta-xylosidase